MAGRIPRVFINDLLARTDIVDLIDARVKLKKQGKNFHACCPFHNEKTPSFTVNGEKQFYHCFGCGAHGNAIDFLMNYDKLEFVETVEDWRQCTILKCHLKQVAAPARSNAISGKRFIS